LLKSESQAWFARFADYYKVFYLSVTNKKAPYPASDRLKGMQHEIQINSATKAITTIPTSASALRIIFELASLKF
jgi:hypothetical protein